MPVSKTTSRFTRPQRNNGGILHPEFSLFSIVSRIQEPLAKGTYLKQYGSVEPVVEEIQGVSDVVIERVFSALRKRPPRVSLGWPRDRIQAPSIVIVPNEMNPKGEQFLRHSAGSVNETVVEETNSLTLIASAVGGETSFELPRAPIVRGSEVLIIERGGEETRLFPYDQDYQIDVNGKITLNDALLVGDKLSCSSWKYYSLPGGKYFANVFTNSVYIIIDSPNQILCSVISGLVWRELITSQEDLDNAGFSSFSFSRTGFTLWDTIKPTLGYRINLVVSGDVQWTTFRKEDPIRGLNIEIDETSGMEEVVSLSMDFEALSDSSEEEGD